MSSPVMVRGCEAWTVPPFSIANDLSASRTGTAAPRPKSGRGARRNSNATGAGDTKQQSTPEGASPKLSQSVTVTVTFPPPIERRVCRTPLSPR